MTVKKERRNLKSGKNKIERRVVTDRRIDDLFRSAIKYLYEDVYVRAFNRAQGVNTTITSKKPVIYISDDLIAKVSQLGIFDGTYGIIAGA